MLGRIAQHSLPLLLLGLSLPLFAQTGHEEIFVSGFNSNAVHRYRFSDGSFVGLLDTIPGPQSLVYGPDGLLYVVSEPANKVLRYDPVQKSFVDEFIADDPATPEDETGGLDSPTAGVFGPDGHFFVSSFNGDSVLQYDGATGDFQRIFVTQGLGGLDGPDAGMTFGPDGHLYVPSFWNHQVLRFDGSSGAFLDAFVSAREGGLRNPRTLRFRSDGLLYVSSEGTGDILRFDLQGNFVDTFCHMPDATGFVISPQDGNVYATSSSLDNVRRFDGTTGDRLGTIVPTGDGGLQAAVYLALLPEYAVLLGRLTPGSVGSVSTLEGRGATPSSPLFLVFGTSTASIKIGGCPHLYLGIGDLHFAPALTGADGAFSFSAFLDPVLTGLHFYVEAFDPASCRLSNLVSQTIQ